jgi:hypothetical protein
VPGCSAVEVDIRQRVLLSRELQRRLLAAGRAGTALAPGKVVATQGLHGAARKIAVTNDQNSCRTTEISDARGYSPAFVAGEYPYDFACWLPQTGLTFFAE